MDFKFPDVGEGIHEGIIVSWHVKPGDTIKRDGVLCEIETDKAIVEIPSPQDGVIEKIYHQEGEEVKVGEVLVSFEGEGGSKPETDTTSDTDTEKKDQGGVVGSIVDADNVRTSKEGPLFDALKRKSPPKEIVEVEPKILPAIRKLAAELNVDLSNVIPSGIDGRITKDDVEKAAGKSGDVDAKTFEGPVEHEKLSPVRKTIARHLRKTFDEMIPVTQIHYCDVTELAKFRKDLNEKQSEIRYTFLPFIFMALIEVVKEFPVFNAELSDTSDDLVLKKFVNLGFAVDSEAGLFVPVIRNAQEKDVKTIAQEIVKLAEQVKDRSISHNDLTGASITVSNYGSLGTAIATPVIYHPNTCILGIGAYQKTPKLVDGNLEERFMLPLAITYDHRVIDGADAARFLNVMCERLESKEKFGAWNV